MKKYTLMMGVPLGVLLLTGCLPDEKPLTESSDSAGMVATAGVQSETDRAGAPVGGTSVRGQTGGQTVVDQTGGRMNGGTPARETGLGGNANTGGVDSIGGAVGGNSDTALCEDESIEQRPCGLNDRGEAQRTCEDGTWSPWGTCIDIDQCTDGADDEAPCGLGGNGQQVRVCDEGQWGEFGPCVGGDSCIDEQRELRACGRNDRGVEVRICQNGDWQDFEACDDPDICNDNDVEADRCGLSNNGMRSRTCVNGRWTIYGPCTDPDERCVNDEADEVSCGLNGRGTILRTCVDGRWQLTGTCTSRDVCVDLSRDATPCGLNERGRQTRSCVAGQWSEWGDCDDPDTCVDEATEGEVCGLNERGLKARECLNGQWTIFGPCMDPDLCMDGMVLGDAACGLNERGQFGVPCIDGQWSDAQCNDPDECVDDTVGTQRCGRLENGEQQRNCVDGTWTDWSLCNGDWVCPDLENPACGPPRSERCNGLDEDHDGRVDEGLIPDLEQAQNDVQPCVETPFGQDIAQAIARGLQWMRNQENGQGHLNDAQRRTNFLAVLAMLGQPVCAGQPGPGIGFNGLNREDQELVIRLVRSLIEAEESMTDPNQTPYVYVTGGNLSALSQYSATGGPDDVGAPVTVTQAIANGVVALQNNQGNQAPNNVGGWNYGTPTPDGDLSTTHFAGLGLSAASRILENADQTLPNVVNFLMAGQAADGGSGYRPNDQSSSSMTAAALRLYRLAGINASDNRAQASLRWLKQNWTYEGMVGGNFERTSTYYYFWAVYKALALSTDDGLGGELFASDFGARDPAALGYPEEEPSYYFDLAYTLLQWQNPETGVWGRNGNPNPVNINTPSPNGWSEQSSHLFSLLVLERFGVAVDSNLAVIASRPQCSDGTDNDEDGLIDMDDPECVFACTLREAPVAACRNQRDDDNDGLIDFPSDLGCHGRSDDDEGGDEGTYACFNQLDDDGDGRVDYPDDPDCINPIDNDEAPQECGNGEDDDGNGLIDFPNDPGCHSKEDASEAPAQAMPACADGDDNDEDGLTDFPDDSDCLYAGDISETKGCPEGVRLQAYPVGAPFVLLDTSVPGGVNALSGSGACESPGTEVVFVYDAPEAAELTIRVDHPETEVPTVVYARQNCTSVDIGCGVSTAEQTRPLSVRVLNPIRFFIVVDHPAGMSGRVKLSVEVNRVQAACSDLIDNDRDGLVDLQDPGCRSEDDVSELDTPDSPPICSDNLDNDGDGRIDYPFDPGCAFPGDDDEADPAALPACSNAVDDDGDMVIDFPFDPGCSSANDDDEVDPEFELQCSDGNDNDGNGRVDFPDDPGCRSANDSREETDGEVRTRCDDGIDNDVDGLIDLNDPGCTRAFDNDETDPPTFGLCGDGIDNDGDGRADYPADDGCAARGDACEQQGFAQCGNQCMDVHANPLHCGRCGRACPTGIECIDGRCGLLRARFRLCGDSDDELSADTFRGQRLVDLDIEAENGCEPGEDVQAILVTPAGLQTVVNDVARYLEYVESGGQIISSGQTSHAIYNAMFGTNIPRPAQRLGSCRGNILNTIQFNANDHFWFDTPFIPVGISLTGCGYPIDNLPDVIRLAGWTATDTSLGYLDVGSGRIWFVESNWSGNRETVTALSDYMMESMILGSGNGGLPPCLDGIDNDSDGATDLFDPGCSNADDPSEEGNVAGAACSDGIDNDGDSQIDFPNDIGCLGAGDGDETSPPIVPDCSNGLDDDADGRLDFPFDPGCTSRADTSEFDEVRYARCSNGRDDDGDGRIDFPADFGCFAASDDDETNEGQKPACANGRDDDRDGVIDWPNDPGCFASSDPDEVDPAMPPQCFNGIDDDDNGLIDFPVDPGCRSAGDVLEKLVGETLACANGRDDDEDGLIDFPADRGCAYAADDEEADPYIIPARCGDGVDNDGDGAIDLNDFGCVNREDDDETDVNASPRCGNGIDDDADGLVDWPADPGCQARGDTQEFQGCGGDLDAISIPRNGTVFGQTLENGADRFTSAQCGGLGNADRVYRYVLSSPVEQLTFDANFPQTNYGASISVRRDCDELLSEVDCAPNFTDPEPTIRLQNPEVGEYYIIVDGGGVESWQPSRPPVGLPADPRGYRANADLNDQCWQDGGNDAFDCFGRPALTFNGQSTNLNTRVTNGQPRRINANGFEVDVESRIENNVWRFTIQPTIAGDDRPVTLNFSGDLGSDGNTQHSTAVYPFRGRNLTVLHTNDGRNTDPPITMFLLTSRPDDTMATQYSVVRDDVTITNPSVRLPATLYVALSYADPSDVAQAIFNNIEGTFGDYDNDTLLHGQFKLRVFEGAFDEMPPAGGEPWQPAGGEPWQPNAGGGPWQPAGGEARPPQPDGGGWEWPDSAGSAGPVGGWWGAGGF